MIKRTPLNLRQKQLLWDKQQGLCAVDGCHRNARSKSAAHCEAHYYRIRRNGTLALTANMQPPCGPPIRPEPYSDAAGYLTIYAPWHTLTQGKENKGLREHRAVMFREHGYGPYVCHWCAAALTWDEMDIDHLDDNRQNNDPGNIVAACHGCNVRRASHKTGAKLRKSAPQYSFGGKAMCLGEWAAELKLARSTLSWRLERGWPIERALSAPRGKFGPRSTRHD